MNKFMSFSAALRDRNLACIIHMSERIKSCGSYKEGEMMSGTESNLICSCLFTRYDLNS